MLHKTTQRRETSFNFNIHFTCVFHYDNVIIQKQSLQKGRKWKMIYMHGLDFIKNNKDYRYKSCLLYKILK